MVKCVPLPRAPTPRPPAASSELRALLQAPLGAPADAGAAAAAGPSGATPMLGSVSRLSPVRASKKAQGCLGANVGQVRMGLWQLA